MNYLKIIRCLKRAQAIMDPSIPEEQINTSITYALTQLNQLQNGKINNEFLPKKLIRLVHIDLHDSLNEVFDNSLYPLPTDSDRNEAADYIESALDLYEIQMKQNQESVNIN